jgi:uncharacterized protein (TIGR03032 family)
MDSRPSGGRANAARCGVLTDVASGEVITRGLSISRWSRWYGGRLWVCESGAGTVGFVDQITGSYGAIIEVPGFTRGLDFAAGRPPEGKIRAFLGRSQVRESAVVSGIPITERLTEEEPIRGVCDGNV